MFNLLLNTINYIIKNVKLLLKQWVVYGKSRAKTILACNFYYWKKNNNKSHPQESIQTKQSSFIYKKSNLIINTTDNLQQHE